MKRIMSKEEFLSVYERQQASGLTIKDFCENEAYSSSCLHIPADTRSAFPVISVQSPVSIQCCWQS